VGLGEVEEKWVGLGEVGERWVGQEEVGRGGGTGGGREEVVGYHPKGNNYGHG